MDRLIHGFVDVVWCEPTERLAYGKSAQNRIEFLGKYVRGSLVDQTCHQASDDWLQSNRLVVQFIGDRKSVV